MLYDHQVFTVQQVGGVSRYYRALLDHAAPTLQSEVALALSNNLYLQDGQHSRHLRFFPNLDFRGRFSFMWRLNARLCRRTLRQGHYDVFHPTLNDNDYFLDDLPADKPLVITIHDMIAAMHPEQFPWVDQTALPRLAARAAHIITVSEHTRADVLRLLPVAPERVSVIHHGFTPTAPTTPRLAPGYLLNVGTRAGYKNFDCVLLALAELVRTPATAALRLVCAGGGPATAAELELIEQLDLSGRVHFTGTITESELAGLYRHAAAFVFASHYEGFGFPILEAFGQQCPVVLSNASCFPEIAQDAALYFDPHQPSDLAVQIELLLRDAALRTQLIELGSQRLRDFTWARTAARTHEVYRAACRQEQPVLI
ncbi:glycosyltransferase family 4 protein [Hymenobacter chitinivorans]|uniref:glycosyltransferase family 4 protein n=1 Tax=Hymenobacter chitinivorans TaxID=89969 RepID=UPI001472C520|nr:glycosyltransferase family 1 protein [Hymenobacter chitinivorans]